MSEFNSVGVVIVNWNSWDILARCLEKLQRQTVQAAKIVVIDNASTSPPPEGIFREHSSVEYVQNSTNRGFASANNQALQMLEGSEWVALLNPDAFPESDWLERLITAARSHPEAIAFGSRQLCQGNPDLLDGIGDNYHVSGLIWRERYGTRQQGDDLILREIFSPCAAAALYRRQALMDVGGFDEDYFCYVEDVDLGFRLRLAGHKAMYVPDALVHHVGSATTGGRRSDFAVYHGHRNLVWAFVKNMPGILFWFLLPLHLLLNAVAIAVFVVRGQARVIFRAKWDAIKGLPQAWSKRKQIQSRRIASVAEIWRVLDKRLLLSKKVLGKKY